MAEAARSLEVFVSYSRADVAFADQLVLALEDKGFRAILDRHDISGAENWRERLGKLILSADAVAFVLTEKSAISEICAWEVEEAKRLGKRIIPVTPEPLGDAKAPEVLSELNWIPFYAEPAIPGSGFYYGVKRIHEALSVDLDWLRAQTRYSERALEWEKDRREDLLLRGEALKEAEAWQARTPAGAQPPALIREYLSASGDAEQTRQVAAKAQVEERERALKTAEAAVAERQAAIEAKTRTDRLVRVLAISSVAVGLVLVVTALAGLWIAARNYAESAERNAALFAREAADLTSQGDKTLAMLVALSGDPAANKGVIEKWLKPGGYPAAREALARAYATNRMISRVTTGEEVTAMTELPGGRRFVSFHAGGKVRVWEVGRREPLQTFALRDDRNVVEAVVMPGGAALLLRWGDPVLDWIAPAPPQVMQLADGALGRTFGEDTAGAIHLDPESGTLLTAGHVNADTEGETPVLVEAWRLADGERLMGWQAPPDNQARVVWVGIADDALLAISENGAIIAWDVDNSPSVVSQLGSDVEAVTAAMLPEMLVVGGENGRIYGVSQRELSGDFQVFPQDDGVVRVIAGAKSESMILLSQKQAASLYRATQEEPSPEFGEAARITAAVFLSDDQMAATGSPTGEIIVWSLARSFERLYPKGPQQNDNSLWGAQLTADGRAAVLEYPSSKGNGLWTADGGEPDFAMGPTHVSRDGAMVVRQVGAGLMEAAASETSYRIEVLRLSDGAVLQTVDPAKYTVGGFLPNGQLVLKDQATNSTTVWTVGAPAAAHTITHGSGYLNAFDGSADGKLLAFASDTDVTIIEADSGRVVQSIPQMSVTAMAFHPDGQRLALGHDQGALTMWRVGTSEPVEAFAGHSDMIMSIAFNSDGSLIATGAMRGQASLWRLGQADSIQPFDPGDDVYDVVFDPKGAHVIMATGAGVSRWAIEEVATTDAETQVKLACQRLSELGIQGFTNADVLRLPILRGLPTNPCAVTR